MPVTSPLEYSSLLGSAAPVLGSSCGVIRILETKNFAWFCPVVSKMWQMPQSPLLFMFTYCHSLFAHPQCTCCPWCKNMEKVKKKPAKTPKTQTNRPNKTKTRKGIQGSLKAQSYIEYAQLSDSFQSSCSCHMGSCAWGIIPYEENLCLSIELQAP